MAKSGFAKSRLWTDRRSQDLIEVLPAAVYVCADDGTIVSYNRRAAELWGREPALGDTDERFCGAYRLHLPDGTFLPHSATPMELVLRTGEPARDMEVVIERTDGTHVTVLVNIAPLFDDEGTVVGAVNCFQDLSARKQAERERAELTEELHQSQKMDALGQLMAGVTHDFNNLLTAVLGNLDLLEKRITDKSALALLHNASRVARRGAVLNGQLLAFARKHELMPQAVDLHQILTQMVDLLQITIGDMIDLEMRTSREVWPALVDPNQIELVILNLAINARDAMPRGGRLTIETRNATFGASDCPKDLSAGEYAVLLIRDTGTGMSDEVRAKALEPFFTTKGPGKGSGLGLSMALDVTKRAGGVMRIASRLGEGTSVEFYFPRAGQGTESEKGPRQLSDNAPLAGGEVVLVVDDDRDVREVTAAMLASSNYFVIEAGSGAAAMEILASETRVDLMLVDIYMPDGSGIDTERHARERRPNLPILFSTGDANVAFVGGADIHRNRIVCKPYRRDELLRKVRAGLERRSVTTDA